MSIISWISPWPSVAIFPASRVTSFPSGSFHLRSSSPIWRTISPRRGADTARQPSTAFAHAATVASYSARVACGTEPSFAPVAGSNESSVLPPPPRTSPQITPGAGSATPSCFRTSCIAASDLATQLVVGLLGLRRVLDREAEVGPAFLDAPERVAHATEAAGHVDQVAVAGVDQHLARLRRAAAGRAAEHQLRVLLPVGLHHRQELGVDLHLRRHPDRERDVASVGGVGRRVLALGADVDVGPALGAVEQLLHLGRIEVAVGHGVLAKGPRTLPRTVARRKVAASGSAALRSPERLQQLAGEIGGGDLLPRVRDLA